VNNLKKTTIALISLILIIVLAGSSYGVIYSLNHAPSSSNNSEGTAITIVDPNGDTVKITKPVKTVVCLDAIATEVVCALGCENRIIGVDTSSTFPPSVTAIQNVGESYSPSIEKIIELKPDLVFGGAPLNYFDNQTSSKIEAAGIPVFICESVNPPLISSESMVNSTCALATQLGLILDEQSNATKLVNYMRDYENLVNQRLSNLTESEKPLVYYEWYTDWQTKIVPDITLLGGINIAENQSQVAPILSPEFVTEANPDIIIRMISSTNHTVTDFTTAETQMTSRSALQDTNAIKGKVYICDYGITGGIESVVGYLQWAKWIHPELFNDINPVAIHQQMVQEFFSNTTLEGVYAYP
jgi:iron complex transport system substrate-binding protein